MVSNNFMFSKRTKAEFLIFLFLDCKDTALDCAAKYTLCKDPKYEVDMWKKCKKTCGYCFHNGNWYLVSLAFLVRTKNFVDFTDSLEI